MSAKNEVTEVIDDADLEVLLETYYALSLRARRLKETAVRLREMLPSVRTAGKTIVCGRFTVKASTTAGGKDVAFKTSPTYRLRVSLTGVVEHGDSETE